MKFLTAVSENAAFNLREAWKKASVKRLDYLRRLEGIVYSEQTTRSALRRRVRERASQVAPRRKACSHAFYLYEVECHERLGLRSHLQTSDILTAFFCTHPVKVERVCFNRLNAWRGSTNHRMGGNIDVQLANLFRVWSPQDRATYVATIT